MYYNYRELLSINFVGKISSSLLIAQVFVATKYFPYFFSNRIFKVTETSLMMKGTLSK